MQKQIRKRLPDPESKNSRIRNQPKPRFPESRAALAKKQRRKLLQHKHRNARNAYRLDSRREILSQVKPVAIPAAENRAHSATSLKRQPTRVKAAKDHEGLRRTHASLVVNSHLRQEIRVIECRLFQPVISPRRSAMPRRTHIRLQKQSIVIRAHSAHLCNILRGLPIHHLAVIERRLDQHVRVSLRLDVVVRRIRNHVIERGFFLWIAPLLKFRYGQWQRFVQHRIYHVNKRNSHQRRVKQIRPHIQHYAHQQPACASPFYHQPVLRPISLREQILG